MISQRHLRSIREFRIVRGALIRISAVAFAVSLGGGCHILRPHPVDLQSSIAREMTYNGIDAMQRGRTVEAQNLFTKAAEVAPEDQRIRAELARTFVQNGQIHQAIAQMQKAVELSGGEASYHVELGQLFVQTGQLDLARQEADRALKNNRRLATAWALKGQVEQAMGQLDQARTSLHRALAHDPDLNDVRFRLGQVYYDLHEPQRSLSVLDGLLRHYGPGELPPKYLLLDAQALAEIGQLDKAAEVLAQAADGPEPMPEMLLELSRIQILRGDAANARRTLSRGRELFGNQPEFQHRLDELPPGEAETAGVNNWK